MSIYQWFVFFLFIQLVHFLGTWKLYVAAGEKAGTAVPVYNAIVLMKIIGRPTVDYFTIYSIINLIMFPIMGRNT
jgi:signal peptidase I